MTDPQAAIAAYLHREFGASWESDPFFEDSDYLDHAKAILELMRPEWKGIETAPTTTNILGWGEHLGMRTIDLDADRNPWSDEGQHPIGAFSHWMPLPEPPAKKDEKDEKDEL